MPCEEEAQPAVSPHKCGLLEAVAQQRHCHFGLEARDKHSKLEVTHVACDDLCSIFTVVAEDEQRSCEIVAVLLQEQEGVLPHESLLATPLMLQQSLEGWVTTQHAGLQKGLQFLDFCPQQHIPKDSLINKTPRLPVWWTHLKLLGRCSALQLHHSRLSKLCHHAGQCFLSARTLKPPAQASPPQLRPRPLSIGRSAWEQAINNQVAFL
mmetsp:Transcript_62406/g.111513  ORF Transcript_62406/g.111513 Transcript_62406/m.111513 type:complete len:209 (-) Transcript_62406:148-774(-)